MIDTHAHYTHQRFRANDYKYLSFVGGEYRVSFGNVDKIFGEIKSAGIEAFVEPAIGMDSNERILQAYENNTGFMYPAAGLHPACCKDVKWSERSKLDGYASHPGVVAVGETGLDYLRSKDKKGQRYQKKWFKYQIRLAHRKKLPIILHTREPAADSDALKILKRFRKKLHSGVAHCFTGDAEAARGYNALGFYIGIGGALMQQERYSRGLREAVKETPLSRILLETDAPYMIPDCTDIEGRAVSKDYRNTSTVIIAVAGEIAAIKGVPANEVLKVTGENAKRLFGIS